MSVSDIVVGKVYRMGLAELNDDSPPTRIQWHIGVVLRWDPHSRISLEPRGPRYHTDSYLGLELTGWISKQGKCWSRLLVAHLAIGQVS